MFGMQNTVLSPPEGAVLRQALAQRVTGDMAAFYKCSFYGYQDMLYDHRGRHSDTTSRTVLSKVPLISFLALVALYIG